MQPVKRTTCNDKIGFCNSMYHLVRWKQQLEDAIVSFVSTTVTTSLQCSVNKGKEVNDAPSVYRLYVELILAMFTSGCEDVDPEDVGPEDVSTEGVNALQSRLKSLMAWTVPRMELPCICTNNAAGGQCELQHANTANIRKHQQRNIDNLYGFNRL